MRAEDELWEAVVTACSVLGPVEERRSRYADKPALVLGAREFAHREAPGVIDIRVTAAGWRSLRGRFGADPAVRHDPRRRDWIELTLRSGADVDRLHPVLSTAVDANR